MKRSVCAFLFFASLCRMNLAQAAENTPTKMNEELANHVMRLNDYLKVYEIQVYRDLIKHQLEDFYQVESRDRFYFSYEKVFLYKIKNFRDDSYDEIFQSAGELLKCYFARRPIENMPALRYLRVKMTALFMTLKKRNGDLDKDITKYTAIFDHLFPDLFSPAQWHQTEKEFYFSMFDV